MDLGYTDDWDDDDGFDFGDYYDPDYCSSDHPINKSVKYQNVPSEINQDSTKVSRRSGGFGSPSTLKTNEKLNLTAGLGRGKSGGFGGKNTRSKFQSKKELESQGKKNKENGKFLFSRSNDKIKTIHLEEEKNHKLAEDFRAAITNGNIDAVKTVLTQGLSVDSLLKSSWTGLMYAANNGLPDVVALLIEHGANVNYQKDMFTVIMAACSSDCEAEDEVAECLKILIEKGAKINSRDRYHMTPLMYTCRNGREKLVEILLQQKPDINKQDQRGWTALCWAASRGHGRIARMLIDNNANLTLYTNDGQSAEDLAYEGGFTTLADVLNNLVHPNRFIDQNIRGNEICDTSGKRDCVRFGDLEMFLFGLELGHLIPLLQEHKINFEGLLQLTDSELQQLGVSQVGVRKKILSATHDVHTKEWDLSLLPSQTLDHVNMKVFVNVYLSRHF
ncbi:ankyrin repeat, SAM and basic leucine zipper domain-containing protein 1-like isoform X2 [Xenia sp. Carnegie-2017]|uniref:ankyrin repeat, SAM and basic leucine zipper domain-containing protein 1-like isoform X2 n=1 Tax=Xenia sp. Carnegie-2017 TaxID=2897299 RepID=UPI001F03F3D7|nr:ankyrin repeat, SAM and basic leucine zipper domain-containing protein 1-like isoform X2 [Xenia sp. Carnegie-2017]